MSLLIRHVGHTALRLSRPGDSSLTTEPASGSSAVTQSEELLVVLALKLSLCTRMWNCGWSSSSNPEWVGEPVNHFAHVQWLSPSACHCCGIELVHGEPCRSGSQAPYVIVVQWSLGSMSVIMGFKVPQICKSLHIVRCPWCSTGLRG